jgi:L-ascorbate metabolism protein UlaG (beta-lactamase superfamily)
VSLKTVLRIYKAVASISLLISMALACGLYAQQSDSSSARLPAWNDNSLINIQKSGGDPTRAGNVKLDFYGHDAFKITSPAGLTILTDPWRNDPTGQYPKWFLNEFPALRVDIVVSTHAHFDHDAVERPNGLMVLERLVGQYRLGDTEITGLDDKHQCDTNPTQKADRNAAHVDPCPPNNVIGLDNAIQIIATGGLRIAVWGDNRGVPDPSLDHYVKNVDVLILPVDTVLTRPEVDAIVRKYDPKSIIPAHYFVAGLTAPTSGLESADSWVNDQEKIQHADVRRLERAELTLNPGELKDCHHRIYYFGSHFEKN